MVVRLIESCASFIGGMGALILEKLAARDPSGGRHNPYSQVPPELTVFWRGIITRYSCCGGRSRRPPLIVLSMLGNILVLQGGH